MPSPTPSSTHSPTHGQIHGRRHRGRWRTLGWAVVFLGPSAVPLILFTAVPMVSSAWVSLHEWNLISDMRWVGLEEKAASLPYQLSGGQMQRVAIARALVHSPDLLIADEPTGNLDTASGDQVLALIRESASRYGAAVLMATHSAEAAAIADVRVHLRDGRVQLVERA